MRAGVGAEMRMKVPSTLAVLMLLTTPSSAARPLPGTATARKGPIELTLKLYKTTIKRGEPIWWQIQIKNISKKPLAVYDKELFNGNDEQFKEKLAQGQLLHMGLYVEARAQGGESIYPYFHPGRIDICPEELVSTMTFAERYNGQAAPMSPEFQAMAERWRKKGLSPQQINEKLNRHLHERHQSEERKNRPPLIELKPGQKATTRSWAYHPDCKSFRPNPPMPPKGFAEFAQSDDTSLPPGRYRFYVVYDHSRSALDRKFDAEHHINIPDSPEHIRLVTPSVGMEILP